MDKKQLEHEIMQIINNYWEIPKRIPTEEIEDLFKKSEPYNTYNLAKEKNNVENFVKHAIKNYKECISIHQNTILKLEKLLDRAKNSKELREVSNIYDELDDFCEDVNMRIVKATNGIFELREF